MPEYVEISVKCEWCGAAMRVKVASGQAHTKGITMGWCCAACDYAHETSDHDFDFEHHKALKKGR